MRKSFWAPVVTVAALLGAGITGGAGASAATAAPAVFTAHPTVVATADGKGARPALRVNPDGKGARPALVANPDGKGPLRLRGRQPACEGIAALAAC